MGTKGGGEETKEMRRLRFELDALVERVDREGGRGGGREVEGRWGERGGRVSRSARGQVGRGERGEKGVGEKREGEGGHGFENVLSLR